MKLLVIRFVVEKHRRHHRIKTTFAILLFLTTMFIASFTLTPYSGFASPQNNNNNTSVQSEATPPSSIPETAIGPTIPPEKGYFVEEIRDGLYWVTDGSYNTMLLVTDEGVVAVDAPPSLERTISRQYLK